MHFAIFQPWGLGDLTMTTPVMSELRRLHPASQLTLIVGDRGQADLVKDTALTDQILEFPQSGTRTAKLKFFLELRRRKVDIAFIGTRIGARSAWSLRILSDIPVIIGDAGDRTFRGSSKLTGQVLGGESGAGPLGAGAVEAYPAA